MTNRDQKKAFKKILCDTIHQKCAEFTGKDGMLPLEQGRSIVELIEQIFMRYLGFIPCRVKKACLQSLEMISPTVLDNSNEVHAVKYRRVFLFLFSLLGILFLLFGVIGVCLTLIHLKEYPSFPWGGIVLYVVFAVLGIGKLTTVVYISRAKRFLSNAAAFENNLKNEICGVVDRMWKWHAETISKNLEKDAKTGN